MKDGITYFGNLDNINSNLNITYKEENNEKEEDNSIDFNIPVKHCDKYGRFFKIQYIPKLNEYIIKDLHKGFGTFIKIQESMFLRHKSLINIGDSYLVFLFTDNETDINNKDIMYGQNCNLNIKLYEKSDNKDVNINKEFNYNTEFKNNIKIGRKNHGNDIELNDNLSSKINCVIRYENNKGWIIKDGYEIIKKNGEIERNFSKNGTWFLAKDNIKIIDKMIFKSNFNVFKCNFIKE